jgi:hypothetical protein
MGVMSRPAGVVADARPRPQDRRAAREAVLHYLAAEVGMSLAMGHVVMPVEDRVWIARRAAVLLQSGSRVCEVVPVRWED